MTDKTEKNKTEKTVIRNLRKSWTQLADMKVGQLILEGGDRAWPELLRRIEPLNKSLRSASKNDR